MFCGEIRKISTVFGKKKNKCLIASYGEGCRDQGPVVQSIISLMSSLMTNSLTVVAKAFSKTLIF